MISVLMPIKLVAEMTAMDLVAAARRDQLDRGGGAASQLDLAFGNRACAGFAPT